MTGHSDTATAGSAAAADRRAAWRTGAFCLALLALLTTAETVRSVAAVVLVFSVFLIVATVWVRAQYVDDLDGKRWAPRPRVLAAFAGTGAALVGAYAVTNRGGLALGGVIVLYLALGYAPTAGRQQEDKRRLKQCAVGLFLASAVAVAGGVWALGAEHVSTAWVLLGAALLVLGPSALTLTAELAVQAVKADPRLDLPVAAAGVLVLVGVVVFLWDYRWAAALTAVLVLLVVALVSGTQADLGAVEALK